MTVNINLSNGLEAVVLCDEKGTMGGRETNTLAKSAIFKNDNYHGVIVGAGDGNIISAISAEVGEGMNIPADSLEAFVDHIRELYVRELTKIYVETIQAKFRKDGIIASGLQAVGVLSAEEANAYMNVKRQELFQSADAQYMHALNDHNVTLQIVGFDKAESRIRKWILGNGIKQELHLPHYETGSGADSSQLYLFEVLQGLGNDNLFREDMLLHVASAYMKSTLNVGVGGTPKMFIVDLEGVKELDTESTSALTNICGYSMVGLLHHDEAFVFSHLLTNATATDEKETLNVCAQNMDMTYRDLVGGTIPLSLIYSRSNLTERLRYNGRPVPFVEVLVAFKNKAHNT